jgi:uncharacterized protein with ParB-like and HNH nuclease domain/predicted transport protein
MKAGEARLLELIDKAPQFVIPIYQRTYSWTERECRQLWNDLLRAGRDDTISVHFVGSIVYIEAGHTGITLHSPVLVIDGQQRLTTVMLLIAALAQALEENGTEQQEILEQFTPGSLRNDYLRNEQKAGDRRYKLLLTQNDRDTLTAIVDNRELPHEASKRVSENYESFRKWMAELGSDLAPLCYGLAKLMVVDVALNRQYDNPQLIFESMNSTGRELTQADLIRNFVLMGLEPGLQTELYSSFWRPMEIGFGQEAYGDHFDGFIRHYLTVKTGNIPNLNAVYEAFKAYAHRPDIAAAGVAELVADLRRYARYFCAMALGKEQDPKLSAAFHDLRELKVDVAYPFLLELYNDWVAELLSRDDFVCAVRLVESYVFRRAISAVPTNSMNKTFSTFSKALQKDCYLDSIKAHFASLPSYRRFPNDEEFVREFMTRDLYSLRTRSYWLRRLENYERKEHVPVEEYTIEHILPQNENLSAEWKTMLGPDWERVHHQYLHTLGNLTLTGYNAEYSDRSFLKKRDMKGGFHESPLRLNKELRDLDCWDEETIQARARSLADQARQVWPSPPESSSITTAQPKPAPEYTIDCHPNLLVSPMRELFEAFRQEVLALDPGVVSEEFLKLYVAYKAETNFVDVVPQTKRLRLSLNMAFPDIYDPRGMSRDVTNLGRWGNGDVEVGLSSIDELPYVIGLVRQALERQLGDVVAG